MGNSGHWFLECGSVIDHAAISGNQVICGTLGGGISAHLRHATIKDNHIINGISADDRSGMELFIENSEVSGNIIDNGGIYISDETQLSTNVEYSNVRSAYDTIYCHHNEIHDNNIKNLKSYGILVYYNNPTIPAIDTINNLKIYDNIIKSPNVGIIFGQTGDGTKVSNIEVYHNTITTDSNLFYTGAMGIQLRTTGGSHNIKIDHNTISGYTYGIYVDTSYYYNLLVEKNDLLYTTYPILSARTPSLISDIGNYKTTYNLYH